MGKKNESIQHLVLDFIQNKDNKNFSALIDRMRPGLYSFAYGYVKDQDLANEVVSQVFVTVWEKIDQYREERGNFSTWAYTIAKNTALGILKNKKQNLPFDGFTNGPFGTATCINTDFPSMTGESMMQELYDASVSAIEKLDEPYKTVMIEREINQKHLNDIAETLGWNLSTVKTRLRKARRDVAEVLYKKYPDLVDSYFGNGYES